MEMKEIERERDLFLDFLLILLSREDNNEIYFLNKIKFSL